MKLIRLCGCGLSYGNGSLRGFARPKTIEKFSPNLVQSLRSDRKFLFKLSLSKLFEKISLDWLTAGHTEVQGGLDSFSGARD